jgi:hypothetical protein
MISSAFMENLLMLFNLAVDVTYDIKKLVRCLVRCICSAKSKIYEMSCVIN